MGEGRGNGEKVLLLPLHPRGRPIGGEEREEGGGWRRGRKIDGEQGSRGKECGCARCAVVHLDKGGEKSPHFF